MPLRRPLRRLVHQPTPREALVRNELRSPRRRSSRLLRRSFRRRSASIPRPRSPRLLLRRGFDSFAQPPQPRWQSPIPRARRHPSSFRPFHSPTWDNARVRCTASCHPPRLSPSLTRRAWSPPARDTSREIQNPRHHPPWWLSKVYRRPPPWWRRDGRQPSSAARRRRQLDPTKAQRRDGVVESQDPLHLRFRFRFPRPPTTRGATLHPSLPRVQSWRPLLRNPPRVVLRTRAGRKTRTRPNCLPPRTTPSRQRRVWPTSRTAEIVRRSPRSPHEGSCLFRR